MTVLKFVINYQINLILILLLLIKGRYLEYKWLKVLVLKTFFFSCFQHASQFPHIVLFSCLLEPISHQNSGITKASPKMGIHRHDIDSGSYLFILQEIWKYSEMWFNFTYLSLACISSVRRAFLYSLHTLCECVIMAFGAPVAMFRNLMTSSNYGLKSQINTNINGDDQK